MRRFLVLTMVLLVGLGMAAGAFHTHPGDGHCNLCQHARVAVTSAPVTTGQSAPRAPEPAPVVTFRHTPDPHPFIQPPLRAPPAA
jgi:hypothetical protein